MKRSQFLKTLGASTIGVILLPQITLTGGDGKYRVSGALFHVNRGTPTPLRPHKQGWVQERELTPGHIVEDRSGTFLRYEGSNKFLNLRGRTNERIEIQAGS